MYMNEREGLTSQTLIRLVRRMSQGKNGVHLRELVTVLEGRGFDGCNAQALKVRLEGLGIVVRPQLKVDGLNSAGIHWADVPQDDASDVTGPDEEPDWVRCMVPDMNERICPERAAVLKPIPLCQHHRWAIAAALFSELSGHDAMRRSAVMALHEAGRPVQPDLSGSHEEVVYFLVLGNRVKIGHTGNLGRRLSDLCLPRSSVAVTLAGGRPLEQRLHAAFAHQREDDQAEWFRVEPPLSDYLNVKAAESAAARLAELAIPGQAGADGIERLPGGSPTALPS